VSFVLSPECLDLFFERKSFADTDDFCEPPAMTLRLRWTQTD